MSSIATETIALTSTPSATAAKRFSLEHLRALFHRKTLGGERHRSALARLLDIDATEAAALAHLAQHGQLTPGQLGIRLGLTSGGTTALIHRLVKAGHVDREPHPRDRRSAILTASTTVIARAEELYAPLVHEMDELAADLSDVERAVIGRYLTAVAELSERHAELLDRMLQEKEREGIGPPAPGLWT